MAPSTSTSTAHRPHGMVLALILASYLMIVLDISIVITGLPKIRDSLGFSPVGLSWVHTAYTLTFGGLLMAGARAGDLFGRKRLLMGVLAFLPTTVAQIGAGSDYFTGAASGLVNASHQLGGSIGLALVVALVCIVWAAPSAPHSLPLSSTGISR